jgi:hypothetical protein
MATRDNDRNDELLKTKQRQAKGNDPQADGSGGDASSLLSALGNARVQRLMRASALHREADGSESVDDAVAQKIQSSRGRGTPLDESARKTLEPAFGEDFSDVRVHADSEADSMNKSVSAEAFTTGTDIFFRGGKYNPSSSDGQKLLAHELTHVVQQRGAPGGASSSDMAVSQPDDASEREAGAVADSFSANVGSSPTAAVSRQEEDEMMTSRVDRQEEEEVLQESRVDRQEEDEMMTSRIDRAAPADEEEMLQTSRIDRQEEEEQLMESRIDREELPEEEMTM